jgi:hypothetical protein
LVESMRLLATDYRHRRGGLPDLFLWKCSICQQSEGQASAACVNEAEPRVYDHAGASCFLEVKSPNDKLADKQEVNVGYCEWCHALRCHHSNGIILCALQIWLDELTRMGAPAAVCRVVAVPPKKLSSHSLTP